MKNSENIADKKYIKFNLDIEKRLENYKMRWSNPGPPAVWKEGAPIGNGNFGAMIYGAPENISFAIGKTDLWDRQSERSNFKGKNFKEVRDAYLNGDRDKFNELCEESEIEHRDHAITAGMFRLHLQDNDSIASPELSVSIYDGLARLEYNPIGIKTNIHTWGKTYVDTFVSKNYDVMAIKIEPTDFILGYKDDPNIRRNYSPEKCELGKVSFELSKDVHLPNPLAEPVFEDNIIYLKQELGRGDYYVIAVGFSVKSNAYIAGTRIVGDFSSYNTDPVYGYLTVVSNKDSDNPFETAKNRIETALNTGYDTIHKEHRESWKKYWERAYLYVDNKDVEHWWYTSLYMCNSIIDPECQSPGLQGVWIKENVPAWLGDYHTNINIQSVYWGLFAANRVDYLKPYLRLVESMIPQAKKDTKEYFQMRGIRFPHAGSIDGYELTQGDWATNLGVSVGGSSWFTQLLWQMYEYTLDKDLLRDRIYGILKDVALFYEDYLLWDEKKGVYSLEPSLYFEALCPRYECWGKNSIYELSLVYAAFLRAIKAANVLGVDKEDVARWEDILKKLPDFSTNDNGEWVSFEDRDLKGFGSHQFYLSPVFPCELASKWHGPKKWQEAAKKTMENPKAFEGLTGKPWCGGQGIREIIRMGFVKEAFESAKYQSSSFMSDIEKTNALTHTWSSHYLQVDHAPGMNSVLSDMLVLSLDGVIRVFPCFPSEIGAGFYSLRVPGGFLVSSEKRGEKIDYIVIESLCGNELKYEDPFTKEIVTKKTGIGEVILITDSKEDYNKITIKNIE